MEMMWTVLYGVMVAGFMSLLAYLGYTYVTQGVQAVGEALDQVFDFIYPIDNVHHEIESK